ncbi:V-type immunoglobulin domain-containing suppressor of T-cell activation [Aplochiton taeniatus]
MAREVFGKPLRQHTLRSGSGQASHGTLSVSAPHQHYTCPTGATVRLRCAQAGAKLHPADVLKHVWMFTPHMDRHCHERQGPRGGALPGGHSHANRSQPLGVRFEAGEEDFGVVLQNVSHGDQGRYCCMTLDFQVAHKHGTLLQKPHSFILLSVTQRKNDSKECTFWDPNPPEESVSATLVIVVFIMALLALPVILVLVYKQRQGAHSSRRAHELVRMDSEAQGHENPVFLGRSPLNMTRTVSQILARQSSETGRHLLSDPGTPLSPPTHGDIFFPADDPIPESPDFLQV